MGRYNAISFDLWMTLIRSNPEFKSKRNEMIFQHFNPKCKSLDEVAKAIRVVDIRCNEMVERTGMHVSAETMWSFILIKLGVTGTPGILRLIDQRTQQLFKSYPPIPYDSNTIPVLNRLIRRQSLYVVSNTGFISGNTIMEALPSEISHLISDWRFSDRCSIAKPNKNIFFHNVDLHVGDNPIADGGSSQIGIDFFQINTNNKTIKDLL